MRLKKGMVYSKGDPIIVGCSRLLYLGNSNVVKGIRWFYSFDDNCYRCSYTSKDYLTYKEVKMISRITPDELKEGELYLMMCNEYIGYERFNKPEVAIYIGPVKTMGDIFYYEFYMLNHKEKIKISKTLLSDTFVMKADQE